MPQLPRSKPDRNSLRIELNRTEHRTLAQGFADVEGEYRRSVPDPAYSYAYELDKCVENTEKTPYIHSLHSTPFSSRLSHVHSQTIISHHIQSYPIVSGCFSGRFQKEAVIHMERGESVFVAAHTSAGKARALPLPLRVAL